MILSSVLEGLECLDVETDALSPHRSGLFLSFRESNPPWGNGRVGLVRSGESDGVKAQDFGS